MQAKTKTSIPGLYIIENFITENEEIQLINQIDSMHWSGNGIPKIMKDLGPLPDFLDFIIKKIINQEIDQEPPNMCIINEYEAGQGIMPHIDTATIFGPVVLSLSLLSSCLMKFTHSEDSSNQHSILLKPRSLLIMTKSSRFDYKHSISNDYIEYYGNKEIIRSRRVSLTFRTMHSFNQQEDEAEEEC
nr:10308_t:CDS:2 [Entrophospora candida]CAG8620970.1 8668_t:CDS:2 [Entrophospora candida]